MKKFAFSTIIPLTFITVSADALITIQWVSEDISSLMVELGPQAEFEWKNRDGTEVRLTGGSLGSKFTLDDRKGKRGAIDVSPVDITEATNPSHGESGESPIVLPGQMTAGFGEFDLTLSGFNEIDDITVTFTAQLVSDGTDNPLILDIFGQGDQLRSDLTAPGSLAYITKWESTDSILLSNGEILDIGSFYLNSFGDPTAFYYNFTSASSLVGEFTVGQAYQFVNDLSLPAVGDNLRFELEGGIVTKQFTASVPEPSTYSLTLTAMVLIGMYRKRKVRT